MTSSWKINSLWYWYDDTFLRYSTKTFENKVKSIGLVIRICLHITNAALHAERTQYLHFIIYSQRPLHFFRMMSSYSNTWWRHQMETFSMLLAICADRWIPHAKASDSEFLVFTLICARINGWVNNREAGDLRRNRAHYDVIVIGSVQRATYNQMSWYQINSRYQQSTCLLIWNYIATWITTTGDVYWPSRRRECLFNSLFRLTTKKHQRSALLSLFEWNPPVNGGFPHKRTVTRVYFHLMTS